MDAEQPDEAITAPTFFYLSWFRRPGAATADYLAVGERWVQTILRRFRAVETGRDWHTCKDAEGNHGTILHVYVAPAA